MIKNILLESIKKQVELMRSEIWKDQLFSFSPPILWFGNLKSENKKILTIGANPSRWEVINKEKHPISRFRILNQNESLEDILQDVKLQNEIFSGYNQYFENKPYDRWFGKLDDPFNVECFLRGLDSSFYENIKKEFTSIHIDLFPFPTMDDYNRIEYIVKKELFDTGWAKNMLLKLITKIDPKKIVVFGRTNSKTLFKDILNVKTEILNKTFSINGKKAFFSKEEINFGTNSYETTCISTNLGNPKPFNKLELKEFGKKMKTHA